MDFLTWVRKMESRLHAEQWSLREVLRAVTMSEIAKRHEGGATPQAAADWAMDAELKRLYGYVIKQQAGGEQ